MILYFILAHCTFLSKRKSQFQLRSGFLSLENESISGQVRSEFFCRTLRTVSSLMDGGIPAFTISLFLQGSFPSLLASAWFVLQVFIEQIVRVVFTDYSFVTTKSPIFIFICLQTVAFEYFQYYLIFDISE